MRSSDGEPPSVQSSNLNEEIGQIQHIFTDKTGTLTCNMMDFRQAIINKTNYGGEDENYIEDNELEEYPKVQNVNFRDKKIFKVLENENHPEYKNVKEALFVMAICHSAVIDQNSGEIVYNASSPDELAIVNFAKFCGVTYIGKDYEQNKMIQFRNKIATFQILHQFDFTSTRKRHSIIIKNENHEIYLYCKGADSEILKRLAADQKESSARIGIQKHMNDYGKKGLRTLIYAKKQLNDLDYQI